MEDHSTIPYQLLQEFRQLVNTNSKETILHRFLETHPELLPGIEPTSVFSRKRIELPDGGSFIPDLIVRSVHEKLFDIIELKGADEHIVKGRRTHITPSRARNYSAKVYQAFRQLQKYSSLFEDSKNREYVKNKLGIEIYRPKLTLIIGRTLSFIDEFERRDLEDQLTRMELITWDDLVTHAIQTARRIIIPVCTNIPNGVNALVQGIQEKTPSQPLGILYESESFTIGIFSHLKFRIGIRVNMAGQIMFKEIIGPEVPIPLTGLRVPLRELGRLRRHHNISLLRNTGLKNSLVVDGRANSDIRELTTFSLESKLADQEKKQGWRISEDALSYAQIEVEVAPDMELNLIARIPGIETPIQFEATTL
ncbi:MAG TPA: Shedu anti-phage system protein SduA domain-containing protein [Blastocatellia bacterium]|nr:Shedu anti-phage system protein SduA domain-containing protein [Blastocatellia bacterium]